MNTVGSYIKSLRLSKGLTQEELGNIIGVKKAAVQKWESGIVTNLKRNTIQALADYFEVSPASFVDEEYQQKYENAIKKFGIYYSKSERDIIFKEKTDILATNPDIETQIECQTEILKCCFSESLEQNNFDLRHCRFEDYVAMVLCQHTPAIPISTECIEVMAGTSEKGYGKKYGMSEGIIYHINPYAETPEEKRIRLIMESVQKLNEEGQLKVLDYADDLATSQKYKKPDTDD